MGTNADCYRDTRARLLLHATDLEDGLPIPATPAWNLRDLLAHLTGVAADVASGNVLEYAQADWTQRQVANRAGVGRDEILGEWDEVTPALTAVLDDPAAFGLHEMYETAPLADLIIHRHDIREAVGLAPTLEPDETAHMWHRRLDMLATQLEMESLPPIELRPIGVASRVIGVGTPAATVRAGFEDLWRSLQGRRTRDAVRSFDWSSDPEPYLPVWPGFVFSWPEG